MGHGVGLKIGICDTIVKRICWLSGRSDVRMLKNYIRIVKSNIDISGVIYKLLEYEKLKKVIFDKDQLVVFDSSPCPDIETPFGNKTLEEASGRFQQLKNSYMKIVNQDVAFKSRLLGLNEPQLINFLIKPNN
jgi:hypothetical protein